MENPFLLALRDALWPHWLATTGAKIQAEYDVLAVEREFVFPLRNPETGGESKSFVEAGKMDLALRHRASGMVCVGEHKTTTEDIGPDGDYWHGLKLDTQVSKYCIALQIAYPEADLGPVVYDVTRRPMHRPGNIPLVDADDIKIVLDGAGERVRTKDGKKFRQTADTELGYVLQTRPETPDEYRDRVTIEIAADPGRYFQMRPVPRLAGDLETYQADAWMQSQQILWARRMGIHPRNPSACKAMGTCEYWRLCTGQASIQPADAPRVMGGYYPAFREHKELTLPPEIEGKQLLTNSRLSTLRACHRKHFLRYEEPVHLEAEQSEALRFGTLWHAKLEEFFKPLVVKP